MARSITLSEDDVIAIDRKLQNERNTLSQEDADLLDALLKKARAERGNIHSADANWAFNWTYHF